MFTNRTGSSWFVDLLSRHADVIGNHEVFNEPSIKKWGSWRHDRSLNQYMTHLKATWGDGRVGVAKVSPPQMPFLFMRGVFSAFKQPPIFFRVRRRSMLDQAISWYIARNTQQWSSQYQRTTTPPDYDFQGICTAINYIAKMELRLSIIIDMLDQPVHEVIYEDLATDTETVVHRAWSVMGLPPRTTHQP